MTASTINQKDKLYELLSSNASIDKIRSEGLSDVLLNSIDEFINRLGNILIENKSTAKFNNKNSIIYSKNIHVLSNSKIRLLFHDAGAQRINSCAINYLSSLIEAYGIKIVQLSIEIAKSNKRNIISINDIILAQDLYKINVDAESS